MIVEFLSGLKMASPQTSVLTSRIDGLQAELLAAIKYERTRAVVDYWIAVTMMLVALGASAWAGFGGLFHGLTAEHAGSLALIPGVLALVESNLKFAGKSDWHYRKLYALENLSSRLRFQLPVAPSADQIAAIASERDQLKVAMNKEWEQKFPLIWTGFAKQPHNP